MEYNVCKILLLLERSTYMVNGDYNIKQTQSMYPTINQSMFRSNMQSLWDGILSRSDMPSPWSNNFTLEQVVNARPLANRSLLESLGVDLSTTTFFNKDGSINEDLIKSVWDELNTTKANDGEQNLENMNNDYHCKPNITFEEFREACINSRDINPWSIKIKKENGENPPNIGLQ